MASETEMYVDLTRSVSRTVASVRCEMNQDYLCHGPGGIGFFHRDFDGVLGGTAMVTYTDGTTEKLHISSEMDPDEMPNVGDVRTRQTVLLRVELAEDAIPF